MKIGVPKEVKTLEFRVGMTPAGVREPVVQSDAGGGIGMSGADYAAAGAAITSDA